MALCYIDSKERYSKRFFGISIDAYIELISFSFLNLKFFRINSLFHMWYNDCLAVNALKITKNG